MHNRSIKNSILNNNPKNVLFTSPTGFLADGGEASRKANSRASCSSPWWMLWVQLKVPILIFSF